MLRNDAVSGGLFLNRLLSRFFFFFFVWCSRLVGVVIDLCSLALMDGFTEAIL